MPYKNAKKPLPNNATCSKRKQLCQELYQYCLIPNDKFKFETTYVKINELLGQLVEEEKNVQVCSKEKRTESDFDNFVQFLNDKNCKLDTNIKICKNTDEDFSIKSNKHFSKGDLIFNVPKDLILTVNNVKETHLGRLIQQDKMLSSMPNVALALTVLYIKQNCKKDEKLSKWTSYMNILPSDFHTPLYFNLDEIKLLKSSQSFNEILYHNRNIARLYAYIFNLFDSNKESSSLLEIFSYENFRWAVSVVSTRQNQIFDENKKPILAMIPLLDMCNHEDGEFCTDFNDETQSALCYANKDINVGDEISIFYGPRTNIEMLIHNGFVCETNKYDKVKLKLGLNSQDILFDKRFLVLKKFGLNNTEYYEIGLDSTKYSDIIPKLFVFVKVFIAKTEQELNEIQNEQASTIESYFEAKTLAKDLQIRNFLTQRISILIKSIELNVRKSSETINEIFFSRLLSSELNLFQLFLDFLGKY